MKKNRKAKTGHVNTFEEMIKQLQVRNILTILNKIPFDYTQWQLELWDERNVNDIGKTAMIHLIHKSNRLELQ